MSEKFSVQAILSARDKDFTAGMKGASAALSSLKSSVTSGLGFGILAGIGQRAFDVISGSVTGLIGDLNESSAAWKTFQGNMEMNGHATAEIASIKSELQDFATKTIYSASDMASTFAQLDAVGTKNTTDLVKGFGGLAAAAENPTQAMKTLSQQATQMAAKPKVQWQDFKLMLEQTPAGIAAVAKQMGMSTQEMIAAVQDGKVATEDFFDAIAKVGTNDSFTKLATEYKTMGQAMDGLTETASNKLAPAFDVVSTVGINAISSLVDKIGEIDGEALAGKVTSFVTTAGKYWNVFKEDVAQVAGAFGDAFSAIGSSLTELTGAFGSTESIQSFSDVLGIATGALTTFAGFMEDHADVIAKVITILPKLYIAYKGFRIVKSLTPFVGSFSGAILKLASGGVSTIAGKLFGIAAGETAAGKAGKTSSKQMLTAAKSFMMMGAAVLMISAGFALLAYSAVSVANAGPAAIAVLFGLIAAVAALGAGMTVMLNSIKPGAAKLKAISVAMLAMGAAVVLVAAGFTLLSYAAINLANAGPLAIACMVGMVASVALLAAGAAALGPALTAGAVGFITFGTALVLVGVGAVLAAASLAIVSAVLPTICEYGVQGALAIAALGASMIVFAAGAALAGVASLALGVGLAVAAVGIAAVGAAVLVLSAGVLILAAGILVAAAGITLLATQLSIIATYGTQAATGIVALGAGILVFSIGALAAGAACVVLGAGITIVAAGLALVGAAVLITAAGTLVLAAGMAALAAGTLVLAAGLMVTSAALLAITVTLPLAATGALLVVASFTALLAVSAALSALLVVLTATFVAMGVGAATGGVAIAAFGVAAAAACVGVATLALALKSTKSSLKSMASSAKSTQSSLKSMVSSVKVVQSGLDSLGSKAKTAMQKLISAFDNAANKAQSSGKRTGDGFANSMKGGFNRAVSSAKTTTNQITSILNSAVSKATSAGQRLGNIYASGVRSGMSRASSAASAGVSTVTSRLRTGYSAAYSAGAYISKGFANGMRSQLGAIRSAAAQMASAADAAIRAKAKIHSPSKVSDKLGGYWGSGWVGGILDKVRDSRKASEELVSMPKLPTLRRHAFAGLNSELLESYEYTRNAQYTIIVPVEMDGREVARITAPYTEEELVKRKIRRNRKKGKNDL